MGNDVAVARFFERLVDFSATLLGCSDSGNLLQ